MKMTPTVVLEVVLELPTLHVITWRPRWGFTNKSVTNSADLNPLTMVTSQTLDMKHEPILQMGLDKMLLRYAYHKPFMVKFPNKY